MNRRLDVFDYIRIIATLAVIMIHTTSAYVLKSNFTFILNQVSRFTIPVFIILSGAMLYFSDIEKNKKIQCKSFLKKRIKKILVPFILLTLIYMVIDYKNNIYAVFSSEFLFTFLKNMIFGKEHLYFIIIIFQFYMLYPLIYKLFESKNKYFIIEISFIITVYFQLAIYLLYFNIYILPENMVKLGYLLFPTWIYFFIYGMNFIKKINTENKETNIFKNFIIWVLVGVLVVIDSKFTASYELSTKPMIIIYAIISFEFFYDIFNSLSKKVSKSINNAINWLSRQSFAIYLFHILVLKVAIVTLHSLGLDELLTYNQEFIILFISNAVLTTLLVYIMSLLPFTEYLGVDKKHA